MIPVGAIWLAVRAAQAATNKGSGRPTRPPTDPDSNTGWIGLAWLVFLPLGIALVAGVADGEWWCLPLLVPCSIPVFPWAWTRYVFIPLGRYKLAHLVTSMSLFWGTDHRGGKCAAAAWALLRRRTVTEKDLAWVDARLLRIAGRPMKTGQLLAHALLSARTNVEDARRLMTSIDWLGPKASSRHAKKLATEWLALDAAERGDWEAIGQLRSRTGAKSWLTRFLIAVARRECGLAKGPWNVTLCLLWALAPGKRRTWRMLQRALAIPPGSSPTPVRPVPPMPDVSKLAPLGAALKKHAAALQRRPEELTPRELVSLGRAWEVALGADELRTVVQRNLALQLSVLTDPVAQVREQALADLVLMIRASKVPLASLAGGGELLERAAHDVREALMTAVELAATQIGQRAKEKRGLEAIDEWREFVAFRELWDAAVSQAGLELQRLAFTHLHVELGRLAVFLFNQRGEKPLGNAMFRFMLQNAQAVGDTEAVRMETKNSAIRYV